MNTLIHSDNTWALWAILVGVAALSIWLEQRFRWAAKVTGCVIALIAMMLLSNFGVIPTESAVYDTVWDYVVPLAIPLLLFQCNIKRIGRESGRLLLIFLIGSAGTTAGALGGFFLLHNLFPELYKVAAMFTGTYIGGSVNFVGDGRHLRCLRADELPGGGGGQPADGALLLCADRHAVHRLFPQALRPPAGRPGGGRAGRQHRGILECKAHLAAKYLL